MYADDTVMYFTNLCTSEIARVVQDDLNRVAQWKVAGLSLIRVKQNQCSLEVGRILPNLQIFCIQLYGKTLERVAKFSYLGVVLD